LQQCSLLVVRCTPRVNRITRRMCCRKRLMLRRMEFLLHSISKVAAMELFSHPFHGARAPQQDTRAPLQLVGRKMGRDGLRLLDAALPFVSWL